MGVLVPGQRGVHGLGVEKAKQNCILAGMQSEERGDMDELYSAR